MGDDGVFEGPCREVSDDLEPEQNDGVVNFVGFGSILPEILHQHEEQERKMAEILRFQGLLSDFESGDCVSHLVVGEGWRLPVGFCVNREFAVGPAVGLS